MSASSRKPDFDGSALGCVMPWKALYTDKRDGRIVALPCCIGWIREEYGEVGPSSLEQLWNSPKAQRIRRAIAGGLQAEVCDPRCPHLRSGEYSESALRLIDGPTPFVENQLLNHREIRERRAILRSKPMLLKALLTTRCNLRCRMCFQDHEAVPFLDGPAWAEMQGLLPWLREITFQGGEVTLLPEFRRFLRSAELTAHPNVRVSLITNGTVLDEALVAALAGVSVNTVVVSVNAATRETYCRIAGTDAFDEVMANVGRLAALASTHPRGTFDLYLSMVVLASNYREVPAFFELAGKAGARVMLVRVVGRDDEDPFLISSCRAGLRRALLAARTREGTSAARLVDPFLVLLDLTPETGCDGVTTTAQGVQ